VKWLASKAGEGLIQGGAWGLAVLLGLWLWPRLRHDVSIPLWVVLLIAGVPLSIAIAQTVRRYRRELEASNRYMEEADAIFVRMIAMQDELQTTQVIAYYANHLYEILSTLRRSMSGTIPGVHREDFIEHGVLEPARDLLRQTPGEDVRLSILVPNSTGQEWEMRYAAGHSLESRQAFRLPIQTSFSRYAYETGELVWSNELSQDSRFMRHPQARPGRDYESMISVPIRRGDQTIGVLNVISSEAEAFEDADRTYAKLIGAVVEIVLALPTPAALPSASAPRQLPSARRDPPPPRER
jgi:GAF domain-containing protein